MADVTRAVIAGKATNIEEKSYTNKKGDVVRYADVILVDNPQYRGKRISMPLELSPKKDSVVAFVALVRSKVSKKGQPYLDFWCVEALPAPAPLLAAVGS